MTQTFKETDLSEDNRFTGIEFSSEFWSVKPNRDRMEDSIFRRLFI